METERWFSRRRAAARSMVRMAALGSVDARRRVQMRVRMTAKAAGRAIRLDWWPQKVVDGGWAANPREFGLFVQQTCV